MRVIGTLVGLLGAVGLVLAAAPTAVAAGDRIDVDAVLARLELETIVRLPGAVAGFDEQRVRAELAPNTKVLVLPYVDHEAYEVDGESVYYDVVRRPLREWSSERDTPILLVEGLQVGTTAPVSHLDHDLPADLAELRHLTTTRDVTERLVVFARLSRELTGPAAESAEFAYPEPVPPSPARLDEVTAALPANRVYNAPGRQNPIDDWVLKTAEDDYGVTVRIAAFPYLAPGEPVVDYAPGLRERLPDDVVVVLQGDWMDIAADQQDKALSARDFAFGDANLGLLVSGRSATNFVSSALERLGYLLPNVAYGRPQPPPQPRPVPFDVQRTVSALAPWVLVGSALVLGGSGLLRHRRQGAELAANEERDLRAESAAATAGIGELGARLLAVEEGGEAADPAAAERHATARLLYDQALTSAAMVEVRRVAEEGLALMTAPAPRRRRKKADPPRAEEPRRRAQRWLGVPVWLYGAVLVGAAASYLVFGVSSPPKAVPSPVRSAVEGLRTSSVWEEPGGPGIVDAARSRELIGDRAVVLVLYAGELRDDPTNVTEPREERCAAIADLVATSVVIMYAFDDEGEYDAEYCVGPEFANADNPVDPEDYVTGVVGGVNLGTRYRVTETDKFAEVEEYVFGFDHYTQRDSPNGVPRRGIVVPPPPTPDALQTGQIALALGGILAGAVALFVLCRAAGRLAGRRDTRTAATRTRTERINARLNRLAETVLHPGQPKNAKAARIQADLAERYVLLLATAEAADADLSEVEQQLAGLEESVT